jgi:cell division protein FtsB
MQGVIVRIAMSVFGLLTLAMLLLAVFNGKGAIAVYDESLKLKALEKQNQTLEQGNKKLLEENKRLESDPSAIEKIGREEHGLVKPGEIILVVPSTPKN